MVHGVPVTGWQCLRDEVHLPPPWGCRLNHSMTSVRVESGALFLSVPLFRFSMVRSLSLYIYIYAVKLKTGPRFALFKVKNWSSFLFLFLKISSPCRKKRIFEKQAKKTTKKNTISKVKNWSNYVAQILGPVFNFNLDQFLTLDFFFLLIVFVFFGGGG